MFGTQSDGVTPVTYLNDVIQVLTEVLAFFTQEPLVYFVMAALVGVGIGAIKKLIPTKRK
jgi:hypothetical protein